MADQFVKLAKMAYNSLLNETYVFSHENDFDHLGLMKKNKSLDATVGPNYSFCFLHLTLQEYLSAIHISLLNSTIEVPPSLGRRGIVSRFLAGLCIHGDELIFLYQIVKNCLGALSSHNPVRLIRCAYECDKIVQKIPIAKGLFDRQKIIIDKNLFGMRILPFDYYLIGHCISHIGGRWSITVSSQVEVDLLVQGLGSGSSKGEVLKLKLDGSLQLEYVELLLELCKAELHCLELDRVIFSENDAAILCKFISPGSTLRKLHISYLVGGPLLPVIFRPSSLHSLTIDETFFDSDTVESHTLRLLSDNSNLKNIAIPDNSLILLAPALHDNTSLVHLQVILINNGKKIVNNLLILAQIVQSNHTIQQLEIRFEVSDLSQEVIQAMVQVVDAVANSSSMNEIMICANYFLIDISDPIIIKHTCTKGCSSAREFLRSNLSDNLSLSTSPLLLPDPRPCTKRSTST